MVLFYLIPNEPFYSGSLEVAMVNFRIWGCERAQARSHPQIREFTTAIPYEPLFSPFISENASSFAIDLFLYMDLQATMIVTTQPCPEEC
jgi:hypothetical protein